MMDNPLLSDLRKSLVAAKLAKVAKPVKRPFAEFKPECERSLAMLRACVAKVNAKAMNDPIAFEKVKESASHLRESLREFNKGHKTKDIRDLILAADCIYNQMQSALDMQEVGDLDGGIVTSLHARCNSELASLSSGLRKLSVEEGKEKPEKDEIFSASDMLTEDEEMRNLGNWKTHLPEMTKIRNKKSFIMTIPVVAILKSPVPAKAFDQAGFDYRTINGHPMLLNQIVLGVNSALVKDSDSTIEKFRHSMLTTLSRKMGRRLLFVSDKGIMHKDLKGFMLFWLMPAHEIDLLSKACRGHVPSEWGLPW